MDSFIQFSDREIQLEILTEKGKTHKLSVYSNDTLEDIVHRIALQIYSTRGEYIYVCSRNYESLCFSYDDKVQMKDPLKETEPDTHFVYMNGSPKHDYVFHSHKKETFLNKDPQLYCVSVHEFLERAETTMKDISKDILFHGIIHKYWTSLPSFESIHMKPQLSSVEHHLSVIDEQQRIVQNYSSLITPSECSPLTIIYENNDEDNSIHIFKIFKEWELTLNIPYMRLYTDSFIDSCCKVYQLSLLPESKGPCINK